MVRGREFQKGGTRRGASLFGMSARFNPAESEVIRVAKEVGPSSLAGPNTEPSQGPHDILFENEKKKRRKKPNKNSWFPKREKVQKDRWNQPETVSSGKTRMHGWKSPSNSRAPPLQIGNGNKIK